MQSHPKRLPRIRRPDGVVVSYQALLRRVLDELFPKVLEICLRDWELNAAAQPFRKDSAYVAKAFDALQVHVAEAFDPGSPLSRTIRVLAVRVSNQGAVEFQRVIGINPRKDLGLGAQLDSFRNNNVGLIKSLVGNQLNEIRNILEGAESEGLRVETLRDRIQDQFSVSKSKADLLARDQTLKLNADITKTRQTTLGITSYRWSTSHDERVRASHQDLDGTIQRWDSPPIVDEKTGRRCHPGEDYQCRCVAIPILPELEEEEPEA